jgi:hypothetical protein
MPGAEPAEHVTPDDPLPGTHLRHQRFIGGTQPARMVHADDAAAGEQAGEPDHAGACRENQRVRVGAEIHPAMSGQPRPRWRFEPADDHRPASYRPAEQPRAAWGKEAWSGYG